jgi:hypothetical protein
MALNVIAENTSLKVSQVVAVSGTITSTTAATVYTVPANSYAVVNVSVTGAATGTAWLQIKTAGTQQIKLVDVASGVTDSRFGVYLGPGDIIEKDASGTPNTSNYCITGVEFINSP